MEYRTQEIRVGFTIFIAALVFTVGLMWFEGFNVGRRTYDLYAVFPSVGGIDPGDAVHVNGVEKGEVKKVALRERDVVVTMSLDASVRIPGDSRVVLQTRGIMGERVVSILLGSSDEYLEPGTFLSGVYDPGISEALASIAVVTEEIRKIVDDVGRVAGILTAGDKLASALDDIAAVAGQIRDGLESGVPKMEKGLDSFNRSAGRVDSILARNSGRIDSLFGRLDDAGGRLPEILENICAVTGAMERIAARLESDDNTLGALVQDRRLLDELEKAISGLDSLVTDVRENPKKYLTVEIF